jgi:hypothetical protein
VCLRHVAGAPLLAADDGFDGGAVQAVKDGQVAFARNGENTIDAVQGQ